MDSLTIPDPPTSVYSYLEEQDDWVPLSRPPCQGDVFAGIEVPPFPASPYAIVLAHPCTMRKGSVLREHVLMAAVRPTREAALVLYQRNGRVMPLPGLPQGDQIAKFEEMVSVRMDTLDLTRRVACLDDYGMAILQQRQIHHMTRYVVEIEVLHTANSPILLELELLEAWREQAFREKTTTECLAIENEVNRSFDEEFAPFRAQAGEASRHSRIRRELLAKLETD